MAIASPRPRTGAELVGTVAHIIWTADDGAAVIARLGSGEVVKGSLPEGEQLDHGMAYRFLGRWETHPKYGKQFAFATYTRHTPHSRDGVTKYLTEIAPNVGKVKAQRLFDALGPDAVHILRAEPERVAATGILTSEQAREASDALHDEAAFQETKVDLYGLFAGRGFPGTLIRACIQRFGARAAEMVRRNPYVLLLREMPGCGFLRCDKLYLDLGHPPGTRKRAMLAAWHELRSDPDGHTWVFIQRVARAVGHCIPGATAADVKAAVRLGRRAGWLETRRDRHNLLWVAEKAKADNERAVAEKLAELWAWPECAWPAVGADNPADDPAGELSSHQIERVRRCLVQPVGIMGGIPGTGKTFSAAGIIRRVADQYGRSCIAVCAPTGKAAVRCSAALARYGLSIEATTIHRLLGVRRAGHDGKGWRFEHHAGNPLQERFLVIDEASMLDTDLAASLLRACSPGTHILFVGDPYQLPPVGHGAPLRDLIKAEVAYGELTEIHRNAGRVVQACAAIKDRRRFTTSAAFDPDAGENLRLIEASNPEEAVEKLKGVLGRLRAAGKFDPVWDVQVLVAVNVKGPLSRTKLNAVLQAELNATGRQEKPNPFRVNDKIICLRNCFLTRMRQTDGPAFSVDSYTEARTELDQPEEVFIANGEIGRVAAVAPKQTVAEFPLPPRLVKILMGKARAGDEAGDESANSNDNGDGGGSSTGCHFDLAYACTCHKLQGSEAPVVIIMIDDSEGARRVSSREWWYTAISRASQLCVLIGDRAVIDRQVTRTALDRRKTFLQELIREPEGGGTK
jgi:exodeoxyribonuclease V alpha subunit